MDQYITTIESFCTLKLMNEKKPVSNNIERVEFYLTTKTRETLHIYEIL